MRLGLILTVVIAVAAGCFGGGSASPTPPTGGTRVGGGPSPRCVASAVHYDSNPSFPSNLRLLPYVQGSSNGSTIAGHLFYYGVAPGTKSRPAAFRIFTHGHVPDTNINMKILWTLAGSRAKNGLTVTGVRKGGGGSFTENFPGGPQFPSIIQIPSAGCWRLSLNTGTTQHLTVLATN